MSFAFHLPVAIEMPKPVQAPLGVQFKHAWYSRLRQEVLVKDTVLPGDAQYRHIMPVH